MKLFLDTANVDQIREVASWGILDGVTTNPSLIAKEGKDFRSVIEEICTIVDGPISAEVISEKAKDMIPEAEGLAKMHRNINIKVPMTEEGLRCVSALTKKGIRTNVTLIFQPNQALLAAKAGASYVSPFVGRLDDVGHVGMDVVRTIVQVYRNYGIKTEVIVASVRNPNHVTEAALAGAHICTVPYNVMKLLTKHQLTDKGIQMFLDDWAKVPKRK
jgi:transaldolase